MRGLPGAVGLICAVLAAFGAAAAPAQGQALQAGVASVDITPASGGTTLGFVRPDVFVEGVHTRLTGRVLVLDDGNTEVALLSTDLGYPLNKDSLVARVANLGFTHETILYSGTHTHAGPGDLVDWQLEQLAEAIRDAHASRVPVRAGWAAAQVLDVSRNRSLEAHLANHGIEQFYGQGKPEDDPLGPEHTRDTTLRVLRVERLNGRPLGAWLNFPVHLTTSTPAVDVWDADLAASATQHLGEALGAGRGFVAMFTNGNSGDLMPGFDAYSPAALMDRHGQRISTVAARAWRRAGTSLTTQMPIDVRWTTSCYCGQEVGPGMKVGSSPLWGLPFLGGSEDGASIFHEPLATEGRRLPAALADPVQGRKIIAAPGLVHETSPELQVIRVGDRLLLAAPGEPSVEMGMRFRRAVRQRLPRRVSDPFVVGLSNDYLGYFTTPEEYEMQHYEGGHTVYGKYTSLLAQHGFVALTAAMAAGRPAPPPDTPAPLGGTSPGGSPLGAGTITELADTVPAVVPRMGTVQLRWSGAEDGIERPVESPFLVLEQRIGGHWISRDSDLGLGFLWRESGGSYGAIYDVGPGVGLGRYRMRVLSGPAVLTSRVFRVAPSKGLIVRGVEAKRSAAGTRLFVAAQNPPPDPDTALLWRPLSPTGGAALLRVGDRRVRARWSARESRWVTAAGPPVPDGARVQVLRLHDGYGNRTRGVAEVRVGELAAPDWPPNIGVGGGRTPGPFGVGVFPP